MIDKKLDWHTLGFGIISGRGKDEKYVLSLLKIPLFYLKLNSHYFGNIQKFSLLRNYIFLCNEKYYVLTCNFSKFKTQKNFGLIKKFWFDQKIGFKSIQLQV